jgi:2-desacetyl-2-hydroxyethyl bacteriochlorophyllide A dehydrogenase
MKAIQILKQNIVEVIDIPIPSVKSEEVLLKIHALGLCGSDLKTYLGDNPMVTYPRVPGHEVAGEIVGIGKNVPSDLVKGSMVTVLPYNACGFCLPCRTGKPNCCCCNETLGIQRDGAAAEYITVPHQKVIEAQGIKVEDLVFIEPFSIGWHAVNRSRAGRNEFVMVIGCGVVGLGAIFSAAQRGAHVIAVDINDEKLQSAHALGAQVSINSAKEDLYSRAMEITGGDGPTVVIEAVGTPKTFQAAVETVSSSGRVVYIGYVKTPVEYETKYFVSKELDIMGSRNANMNEFQEVIKAFASSDVELQSLITKRFEFKDAAEAFKYWEHNRNTATKILFIQQ